MAFLKGLLAMSALLAFGIAGAAEVGVPDREYRLKAVFLFNFAQFVQWPDSAFAGPQAPLVVGILGSDPFDSYLDELVRGESVNERRIVVRRYKSLGEVDGCHVLFISDSESPSLGLLTANLKRRPILTVGESKSFYRHGGMVCFVTEGGRIRLKINLDAVHAADLTVSSKLLRLADVTNPERE